MADGQAPRLSWRHCFIAFIIALLIISLGTGMFLAAWMWMSRTHLPPGAEPTFFDGTSLYIYIFWGGALGTALSSAGPLACTLLIARQKRFTKLGSFMFLGFACFFCPVFVLRIARIAKAAFTSTSQADRIGTAIVGTGLTAVIFAIMGSIAAGSAWYYLNRSTAFSVLTEPRNAASHF